MSLNYLGLSLMLYCYILYLYICTADVLGLSLSYFSPDIHHHAMYLDYLYAVLTQKFIIIIMCTLRWCRHLSFSITDFDPWCSGSI